jgi:hypothetical protein
MRSSPPSTCQNSGTWGKKAGGRTLRGGAFPAECIVRTLHLITVIPELIGVCHKTIPAYSGAIGMWLLNLLPEWVRDSKSRCNW